MGEAGRLRVPAPHPLKGGATFEVSGNGGPFDCHGTAGTITVVDNGTNDADLDAGQLRVEQVCLGSYTITETIPPPDFILDTDTTRSVTVSAADLSGTVGTEPLGAPPAWTTRELVSTVCARTMRATSTTGEATC